MVQFFDILQIAPKKKCILFYAIYQFYRNVFLGYFNESELKNIESFARLETNLVQSLIFSLCEECVLTNIFFLKQKLLIYTFMLKGSFFNIISPVFAELFL